MNSKVYNIITDKIIAELEKGNIPWNKPWQTLEAPMNITTKKPYHGINFFLRSMLNFDTPYFLTYKQAKKLGGNVRKGEKGFPVVFWNFGASFFSAEAKIDNDGNVKNSAAYVKGWLKALNDDRKLIVSAAGKAQKAVDFVLGRNNG